MDFSFDKRVGKNVRALRKEKGWSQEQMAAKLQVCGCDVTRSALAKIEAGQRHVYLYEIYRIREVLDCSYNDLFKENPH